MMVSTSRAGVVMKGLEHGVSTMSMDMILGIETRTKIQISMEMYALSMNAKSV